MAEAQRHRRHGLPRNLAKLTPLAIVFWDQRLSTAAVERMLIDADASRATRDKVVNNMQPFKRRSTPWAIMTQSFIALLRWSRSSSVVVQRGELIAEDHWTAVDHVCYYVLFPAIISRKSRRRIFPNVPVWSMALAMILGITSMFP